MRDTALFLDRDGTVMVDAHYASDPSQVALIDGAAAAIARANAAQIPVVLVTNQSGIGRGLLTEAQYHAVHERLVALMHAAGAHLDGSYFCPHWPERDGPCACRKPGIGMHEQAARDLQLSLARSAYIGDRFRDVEPARTTGGLGVLVPGPNTPVTDVEQANANANARTSRSIRVATTLDAAISEAFAHWGVAT